MPDHGGVNGRAEESFGFSIGSTIENGRAENPTYIKQKLKETTCKTQHITEPMVQVKGVQVATVRLGYEPSKFAAE